MNSLWDSKPINIRDFHKRPVLVIQISLPAIIWLKPRHRPVYLLTTAIQTPTFRRISHIQLISKTFNHSSRSLTCMSPWIESRILTCSVSIVTQSKNCPLTDNPHLRVPTSPCSARPPLSVVRTCQPLPWIPSCVAQSQAWQSMKTVS